MRAGVVTVRFTTHWPWNPSSPFIARLGGSRQWSHCLAIIEGVAYEATMLHKCRAVPMGVAMAGVAAYRDMLVPVADLDAAIAFGQAQDGKGYDLAGAVGLPLMASDNWADSSRWWCSELVFMLLAAGGTVLLDMDEHKRVTQNDIHQCNYPKGEIIFLPKRAPILRHFVDKQGQLMVRVTVLAAMLALCAGMAWRHAAGKPVTATCVDGSSSHSAHRAGTCARHGGVKSWKQ